MQQLTKKALQIFVKNRWWRALKDEEREKTSRNHVIIAKKNIIMMRKGYATPSQKTGRFGENPKKLAMPGFDPVTSGTWTGRCFTRSARMVPKEGCTSHMKCRVTRKLGTRQTAMIKSAGVHVTWTHHPGLIRVIFQRMKVPERVGTSYQASKVRSN